MDFSGFAGNGRPLKWVRTPLHDRDYRKTKQLEESLVQHRSGPEVHSQKSPVPSSDPSEKTSVVSIIRDISSKILSQRRNQKLLDASGTLSCGVTSGKCFARGHGGKKDRKRWNTIQFVVGGQHFQSPEWIFEGHPTTLLGSLEQRKLFFNARRMCYEFPDVLPDVFIAVLEYYQTGLLTRPQRLTLNFFLEQVEVFCLEPEANELLLKNEGVHKSRVSQEVIDGFDQPGLRNWLWNFLEYPSFSRGASVYSFFSFFMTALAVTIFVIETLPSLVAYSLVGKRTLREAYQSPLFAISTACFAFFTVELILRFAVCPNKRRFLRGWTNWTDLISVIPYIVTLSILGSPGSHREAVPIRIITTIRACRLFLLTRVFGRQHHRQQWMVILLQTLWNNFQTLFTLFFLMIICTIGFGGVVYALEGAGSNNPTFATIPWGMWWSVITLTTVGYGDIYPKKALGQIVAVLCGCVGLMFVGFVLESVTYEYHRLMKSNSQHRRYLVELAARKTVLDAANAIRRVNTCHTGLLLMQMNRDDIHICINGADFYLALSDVNRHPNSLLGHPSKRAPYFNPTTGSYFFPRNQDIFPAIHHYYRYPKTILKRPPFITMQRFVEEIEFFQLSPQSVIDFFAYEGIRLVEEEQPEKPFQRYIYLVLEHPRYNLLSRAIMYCSLFCTGCFILNIILESLPSLLNFSCNTALSDVDPNAASNNATSNYTDVFANSTSHGTFDTVTCPNELAFFVIETLCTSWFLFELLARFLVSPSKRKFLKTPMNWIDLIIISPYIFTVIQFISIPSESDNYGRLYGFFRSMRLLRLVSIMKFQRYFGRIQMIFAILRATWIELVMLCYFMVINSVIFGTIMYVVELNPENPGDCNSIPRAMYWAFITMLTIGYGDIIPATAGGKLVAAGVAILGIVFWTLPMTLISDHFANYRRMYEGQDYLMQCLTRMVHLVESEAQSKFGSRHDSHHKISRMESTHRMPRCPTDPDIQIHIPEECSATEICIGASPQPLMVSVGSSANLQLRRRSTKPNLEMHREETEGELEDGKPTGGLSMRKFSSRVLSFDGTSMAPPPRRLSVTSFRGENNHRVVFF